MLAHFQLFARRLDQSSVWFGRETGSDSPSPGGEGRDEGGRDTNFSFLVSFVYNAKHPHLR